MAEKIRKSLTVSLRGKSSEQKEAYLKMWLKDLEVKTSQTYQKPTTGIPKTDLALAVQTSLSKADSALQTKFYNGDLYNPLAIKFDKSSSLHIVAKYHTDDLIAAEFIVTTTGEGIGNSNILVLNGNERISFWVFSKDNENEVWLAMDYNSSGPDDEESLDWYVTTIAGEEPTILIELIDTWLNAGYEITGYGGTLISLTPSSAITEDSTDSEFASAGAVYDFISAFAAANNLVMPEDPEEESQK